MQQVRSGGCAWAQENPAEHLEPPLFLGSTFCIKAKGGKLTSE